MRRHGANWEHAIAVTRPALLLAPADFLDEIADRLRAAGVQDAVANREAAPLFDWLMGLVALQGVSDAVAFDYDARHGGVAWGAIAAGLAAGPSCPRLAHYWAFEGCGYRKGARVCGSPHLLEGCPLPAHDLRKGLLNEAAYSLALFVRDACGGDLVGWIDARLAGADPGRGVPDRAAVMRNTIVEPLVNVVGIGPKLWSMMLAELLLVGDPARERWVAAGAAMIAVDSLVHNFFHRAGILRRLGAEHPYGAGCYGATGCAAVIAGLAERTDARAFNPTFPAVFPRWVQHAIWRFAATGLHDVCNGRRIDDRVRCRQGLRCPAYAACDRLAIGR